MLSDSLPESSKTNMSHQLLNFKCYSDCKVKHNNAMNKISFQLAATGPALLDCDINIYFVIVCVFVTREP